MLNETLALTGLFDRLPMSLQKQETSDQGSGERKPKPKPQAKFQWSGRCRRRAERQLQRLLQGIIEIDYSRC
jgi:hypothetical protein